jgi:hypothetical protein
VYQFPPVNIINARPDVPYDWQTIMNGLRSVYKGASQP